MALEIRKLTKNEFERLLREAPEQETEFIREGGLNYEYFEMESLESNGLLNGRPLYWAALIYNDNFRRLELWTVVNSDVREQKTLYKGSKQIANEWAKKYGEIYATMDKRLEKNLFWTRKIGFTPIKEKSNLITLKLTGG